MKPFLAEIMEVKSRKLASLDISYRLILQTDDPKVLELATLPPDTVVKVEITNG